MAVDPRHQQAIRRANRAIASAKLTLASLEDLCVAGSTREHWPQPYLMQRRDEAAIAQLNDSVAAVATAIEQLDSAERAEIDGLVAKQPFVSPPAIKQAEADLVAFASQIRPGNTERLLSALPFLVIPRAERDQLSRLLKHLDSVEQMGIGQWACEQASLCAASATALWYSHRKRFFEMYQARWREIVDYISDVIEECRKENERLRSRHGIELLAASEPPLGREIAAITDLSLRLSSRVEIATTYAAEQKDHDAKTIGLFEQFFASPAAVRLFAHLHPAQLDNDDVRLAAFWTNSYPGSTHWHSAMLSARRAERSLLRAYAMLFGIARDLAVEQLSDGDDTRWKLADIESGGLLIDVKNARGSFSTTNAYSEHCVPRFKHDRDQGEVVISGVLSPYVKEERPEPSGDQPLIWLGEATRAAIDRLATEFQSDYLDVQLHTNQGRSFIPPWLFEFPHEAYRARDDVLAELKSSPIRFPRHELPIAATLLLDALPSNDDKSLVLHEATQLRSRIARIGLSRPCIFLHIIDRFCRSHRDGSRFPGQALKTVLFPREDATAPLAMFDPLATISNLLDTLAKAEPDLTRFCFTRFRLSAPGIFRGFDEEGREQTIIAYCGGWRSVGSRTVRCGKNPIVLGEDHPCEVCGYLVCSACGYCQQGCPGLKRQQDWKPDAGFPPVLPNS